MSTKLSNIPVVIESNASAASFSNASLASVLRWTNDIGMFAIDRSREDSCIHATEFCAETCFNNKLETAFSHAIAPKDVKNDAAWLANDWASLARAMGRKRNQTDRARFMTRGEAFKDRQDIERVFNIVKATPQTIWWLPTRAWRDVELWRSIREAFADVENVRILASIDPSNSDAEVKALEHSGVSTMYYGDDTALTTPNGNRRFKCPKTWRHLKGHCAICKAGCFENRKQVHVHLKQH